MTRKRQRSKDPRDRIIPGPPHEWTRRYLIGALLVLTFLVTFVLYGGPTHTGRITAHVGVMLALFAAASAPSYWLEKKRFAQRLALMIVIILLIQATGLLPIPSVVGRIISPAWNFERGAEIGWDWSSIDPGATLEDMTTVVLVGTLGMAVVVACNRRRWIVWALRGAALFVLLYEIGWDLVPSNPYTRSTTPPFVDSNHFGAALVIAFPAVLGACRTAARDTLERIAWFALACVMVGSMVWHGSQGPAVACVIIAIPTLLRSRAQVLGAGAVLAAIGIVAALLVPQRGGVSHGRFEIWQEALWGGLQHWLLGSGSGTFGMFIEPLRTDVEMHAWSHAHNDWLQWVVQTGLVGIVGMAAILLLTRSGEVRSQLPRDRELIRLCLIAMMIQAAFEFPLHMPILAMAFVGLFSWWRTTFFKHAPTRAPIVRGLLIAALALNGVALGIQVRALLVHQYSDDLRDNDDASESVDSLALLSPRHPILKLHQAKEHLIARHPDQAIEVLKALEKESLRRPATLRPASRIAFIAGDHELAIRMATRAKDWAPYDERNWKIWAGLNSAVDPAETHRVWLATLRRGFPVVKEAWAALPEGIVWASDLSGVPVYQRIQLAGLVQKTDPEAAVFMYQALRWDHPETFPTKFIGALLRSNNPDAALSYWEELPIDKQQSPAGLRQRASIAKALNDERGLVKALMQVWNKTGTEEDRLAAMEAFASVASPEELIRTLEQVKVSERRLTPNETLLLADAHRRLGNSAECARTISRDDFSRGDAKLRKLAFRLQINCGRPEDLPPR